MANEIEMYYGDNLDIHLTVYEGDGNETVDLTDSTVTMYIRYNVNDDILTNSFLVKQGTVIDAEGGVVTFKVDYDDMVNLYNLKTDVPYPTDFKITTSSNERFTVLRTNFRLR